MSRYNVWNLLNASLSLHFLLHNLQVLLQFPEDPIFLLFAPSREDTCDGEHVKVSTSEPGFMSLLVITSDGCLWWISNINSYESTDRYNEIPCCYLNTLEVDQGFHNTPATLSL